MLGAGVASLAQPDETSAGSATGGMERAPSFRIATPRKALRSAAHGTVSRSSARSRYLHKPGADRSPRRSQDSVLLEYAGIASAAGKASDAYGSNRLVSRRATIGRAGGRIVSVTSSRLWRMSWDTEWPGLDPRFRVQAHRRFGPFYSLRIFDDGADTELAVTGGAFLTGRAAVRRAVKYSTARYLRFGGSGRHESHRKRVY